MHNVHGYQFNDFGAIVAAAALAHDIGNPPFGHSGEKAIGEFFKTGLGKQFRGDLSEQEYKDLCLFEGNANGFKILTQNRPGREGGLRLSYATLGAFMKYPKEVLPVKPTSHIADKKYGVFQENKNQFTEVAEELGLLKRGSQESMSFSRHPLAFLVEAADDICYTIIDFEDGINLGLIPEEFALEYLLNLVRDSINTNKYNLLNNTEDRLSYLRALAINTLIKEAASIFIENETEILNGTYNHALLDKCKYQAQVNDIIKLSVEKVYRSKEVIDKEIAGFAILTKLLEVYTKAVISKANNTSTFLDDLILNDFPKDLIENSVTTYDRLLSVCHYISLMSDSNAKLQFNKLKG